MRYWSLIYALAAIVGVAAFLYAPLNPTWWLPGYEETNSPAIQVLQSVQADLPAHSTALEVPPAPAGAPRSLEAVGPVRDWAKASADRVDGLVRRQFLTTRTTEIRDRLRSLAASTTEALEKGQAGDPAGVDAALQTARDASARLATDLAGALEAVGGEAGALSTAGVEIDRLFIFVLLVTGLTFIGTMMALVWCTWRYAGDPNRKAVYSHGNLKLELVWTIIPGLILVFLAFYQLGAWADVKFKSREPNVPPTAVVTARQFMWRIRYPGDDAKLNTADDLVTINDLHFVKGEPTLILLESEDVIHSFFLPQLRVKQDAMPGWTISVWFDSKKAGRLELLCAELCGWGHYKMRADVVVHESRADFEAWQREALRAQNQSQADTAEPGAGEP